MNLVDNALRHGPPEGPVLVEAGHDDTTVTIRVVDQGAGFSPGLAATAFEPYTRGDGAGPGAGLGLAICRGIVETHGGTIDLEPGPGGRVRVRLPIEPEDGDGQR